MKFFFFILILLTSYTGYTQPYYFRHLGAEHGLPNNTIWCSIQDEEGFMWFGTQNGLSRFDGVHFKNVPIPAKKSNSSSRDDIASLYKDKNGILWVAAGKGLFTYDKLQEKLIPFIDTLTNIRQLVFDNQDRLWFITHRTLCLYEFSKNKLTSFDTEQYFGAKALCKTKDGTVWIADTDGYLRRYDSAKAVFEKYNLFARSPNSLFKTISTIQVDEEGNIYIGTQNQELKKFNTATLTYTDILPGGKNADLGVVYSILPVNEEEIWFGAEKGLFIYNRKTGKFSRITKTNLVPYSLSDDAVLTLYKDRENGIWVGTYFGGLNYSPKQNYHFHKFYPDDIKGSTGANVVREIVQDSSGNIWMALEESGIAKLDLLTNELKHFTVTDQPGSLSFSNVHGLLVNGNDLWLGTHYHGLDIMDLKTGKIKKHYNVRNNTTDIGSNFVVSFLKTTKGFVYTATSSGLYLYNSSTDNFSPVTSIPDRAFVSCLIEDSQGKLWVGTGQGLYLLDPTSANAIHFKDPIDEEIAKVHITSLQEDSSGDIWATTEANGLWRVSKDLKKFRRYTVADGLPSNVCFKVIEDNHKVLWVSTYNGLARLQPRNDSILTLTIEDGLLNNQFNYNSGFKDTRGMLYFGSTKGLIAFEPATRHNKQNAPGLYITGFQINNIELSITKNGPLKQSIQYTNSITLQHNQSSFSIDFAALGYSSPEKIQYSYRMAGIDTGWTLLEHNRKVYFTNLKPGDYLFMVKASSFNFDGAPEKELKITIVPPIWATGWAYLVYAIVTISLATYLLRSYIAVKETEKAKELVDAKLEFFTNIAHEIKTPLTLIKGPLDNLSEMTDDIPAIKPDIQAMEKSAIRLMNLVEQVLDFRQTQLNAYHLHFTATCINDILKEVIDLFEPLVKKRKLDYTAELPVSTIVTWADKEALQKIFTNLMSNAVKYAQTKVTVTLSSSKEENIITIIFSNDGLLIPAAMKERIFEPFFRLKNTQNMKGSGVGLALSRSLVELHNGKLYLSQPAESMNVFIVTIPLRTGK